MELTVGTYKTTQPLPQGDYVVLQRKADGRVDVVFGPAEDLKTRYVAQVADTARVLDGVELGIMADGGSGEVGLEGVAVLDERGRPWAFTGDVEDAASLPAAQALAANERFRQAVALVRTSEIERVREPGTIPAGIVLAQLRRQDGRATEAEVTLAERWMDRHWTEAA